MSVRNYEEYRAEVLEGLGATAEDIRNEASWRAKVLEALGAEYTDEDTRNFERYRLKVLENLSGGGSGGGGSNGEFKIANITWTNLPESFDDYSNCCGCLLVKTEEGFEDYYDIYDFSELILQWDDEWATPPKAIVTTKQPENIGDLAVWIQPYQTHDFAVVNGDAFIWNRGVIIYGDCTLTIS